METSRKVTTTLALAIITLLALSSCSTEDALRIADQNLERTDISITGDITLNDFRQSEQAEESTDLIAFSYYGMNAEYFDFIVDIEGGNTLTIEVYDAQRLNPWQQVDLPYNIYPGQDLEDKLYYTNIKFSNNEGHVMYSTNFDNNIPPGIFIDVFKIIRNDGDQIQCRIRDMILYKTNDPDKTININGTFVGAINFM